MVAGFREKRPLSVIPVRQSALADPRPDPPATARHERAGRGVGIHNELKMLVLDLIGDWIPVCTGMTI